MKHTHLIKTLLMVLLLALSVGRGSAAPLGTEFLYQGFLSVTGSPANGPHQMVFTLFRTGVTTPGPSITNNNVGVSAGVFTVSLDFGAGVFDGTAYELSIAVRAQATTGQFVVLQPRQPLTATPNSQHARTVSSVPDTALSSNVALLNSTPVFSSGMHVTTIRVTGSTGGAFLLFGPTDDCSIGVNPQGPPGLLLRDPRGVRVLNPDPGPSRLIFGPTDDCSLGIDPGVPGLLLRDPKGIRLLSADTNRPPILRFGPTDDCSLGIDPIRAGLTLGDPRGLRLLSPGPTQAPALRFGPTDDCSIGIDPAFPGLVGRDPTGFRILGQNSTGRRLIFGPTMDCTLEANATGPQGLLLRDPRGIRILPPVALAGQSPNLPVLIFGPTDDCSLGIDPGLPGLLLRDPSGIRVLSADTNRPPILRFGPTDDCSLGIDRVRAGLTLGDPRGLRLLSPGPTQAPALRFGPTDDCSIGIDPAFPGLVGRDPIGFRILGQNSTGHRLIFGPTMDCTVEVQPPGPTAIRGLLLRDPSGIRIINPTVTGPGTPPPTNSLSFGPTDDCRITASADPQTGGMRFSDPRGFRFGSQVTVAGTVFATQFVPTSSRRFKNDVKPIDRALEKISKLQGVSFTWTEDKGGREDIGFIAEEVGKVIPEVVSWEADGKNARGVNYDHLVAVAIEGIKAQQTQITTLEREKAELKGSLDTMQAQLDRLTAQMEKMMAR